LWYIQVIGKREYPHRTSFSARTIDLRLTQVASLASRHEQSIVHAAFFLNFTQRLSLPPISKQPDSHEELSSFAQARI
jgi:hypothetical protein